LYIPFLANAFLHTEHGKGNSLPQLVVVWDFVLFWRFWKYICAVLCEKHWY